jgi:DNA-binding response OmpR family regulator
VRRGSTGPADPRPDLVQSRAEPAVPSNPHEHRGQTQAQAPLCLDSAHRVLRCGDFCIPLSDTEWALIEVLVSDPQRWFCSTELIHRALGTHHHRNTSLVRVHMHHIRKKLGHFHGFIESRRGRGYRYRPDGAAGGRDLT